MAASLLLVPLGGWLTANAFKLIPKAGGVKWTSFGLAAAVSLGGGLWGTHTFAVKAIVKTIQFDYNGSYHTWVVPAGVRKVTLTLFGARGGGGCSEIEDTEAVLPGRGGQVITDIKVTPGETLRFYIGGRGETPSQCGGKDAPLAIFGFKKGGFNGGGLGGSGGFQTYGTNQSNPHLDGGPGGGASDVRRSPYGLSDRLAVAGGGGGGGGLGVLANSAFGGSAEGKVGARGSEGLKGGTGGTQGEGGIAGGTGGGGDPGQAGGFGIGGTGASRALAGGGGGGGWYGGGGGSSGDVSGGGGGGGSSYGPPGAVMIGAINDGDGYGWVQYTIYEPLFF